MCKRSAVMIAIIDKSPHGSSDSLFYFYFYLKLASSTQI